MKKLITLVLAAVMALSLLACAQGSVAPSPSPSPSPAASPGPSPSVEPSAEPSQTPVVTPQPIGGTVGFYSDDVDWFSREPYKVIYMRAMNSVIHASLSNAFAGWAPKVNVDYSDYCSNDDSDLFITTLETYINQGIDGFLFDADELISARIIDICDEYNVYWMTCMTAFRDENGKFAHPSVILDSYTLGQQQAQWLYDNYKTYFGDIDMSKLGMIYVDYSINVDLVNRRIGAHDKFVELFPDKEKDFFIADCVAGTVSASTAYDEVSPVITAHSEYDYWWIAGSTEDFGQGGARAAEALGKDKTTMVICIGGDSIIKEWEGGYDGCWVAAIHVAQVIYSEPMLCGLIALMDGRATVNTLWSQWKPEGENYGIYQSECRTITKETYKDFLKWIDDYTAARE